MCHVTLSSCLRPAPYNEMFNVASIKFINVHSVWVNVYKYFCIHSDKVLLANEVRSSQVLLQMRHIGFLRLWVCAYLSINIYECPHGLGTVLDAMPKIKYDKDASPKHIVQLMRYLNKPTFTYLYWMLKEKRESVFMTLENQGKFFKKLPKVV